MGPIEYNIDLHIKMLNFILNTYYKSYVIYCILVILYLSYV